MNLLFNGLAALNINLWSSLLTAIVENIGNRRSSRIKARIDYTVNLANNNNNSGFQKLSLLTESKVVIFSFIY